MYIFETNSVRQRSQSTLILFCVCCSKWVSRSVLTKFLITCAVILLTHIFQWHPKGPLAFVNIHGVLYFKRLYGLRSQICDRHNFQGQWNNFFIFYLYLIFYSLIFFNEQEQAYLPSPLVSQIKYNLSNHTSDELQRTVWY